jgi:hypothetical protein
LAPAISTRLPFIDLHLKRTRIMMYTDPYVLDFIRSLFLTLLIEYVAFSLLNRSLSTSRITASVLLANLSTLPTIWFLFAHLIRGNLAYIFLSEMFAVFCEGIILGLILPISCRWSIVSGHYESSLFHHRFSLAVLKLTSRVCMPPHVCKNTHGTESSYAHGRDSAYNGNPRGNGECEPVRLANIQCTCFFYKIALLVA